MWKLFYVYQFPPFSVFRSLFWYTLTYPYSENVKVERQHFHFKSSVPLGALRGAAGRSYGA